MCLVYIGENAKIIQIQTPKFTERVSKALEPYEEIFDIFAGITGELTHTTNALPERDYIFSTLKNVISDLRRLDELAEKLSAIKGVTKEQNDMESAFAEKKGVKSSGKTDFFNKKKRKEPVSKLELEPMQVSGSRKKETPESDSSVVPQFKKSKQ